jgi:ABC-2 type transport system permease protein
VGPTLLRLFAVVLAAGLLGLPLAIAASIGRGHLPAVGATILLVTAAQVSVLLGVGGWFPFAVPGLLAAAGSPGAPALDTAQVLLVPPTSGLGVWLTVRWWRTAEIT